MRAVSLLPAATDMIVALGAVETLVGVSHECDAPAIATLPRVTSTPVAVEADAAAVDAQVRHLTEAGAPLFTLDEPAISALQPNVLFTQSICDVCAVREEDVRSLARRLTPEPRVVTLGATTLDGIFGDVVRVGEALEGAGEPSELISGLRTKLRAMHQRLRTAAAPRPRVAIIEWTDPLFAAGHWAPELVRRAGGTDVLANAGEHSRQLEPSEVRAADPDIIVVAPCGYGVRRAEQVARELLAEDSWAWAQGRLTWALDANRLLSRPGPYVVDGALTLASIFNPTLFAAPDSDSARPVTIE